MNVSKRGTELVKSFEGFGGRPPGAPYRDVVGVWTIGYGHTKGVGPTSRRLTEPQAAALLQRDLNEHYAPPVRGLNLHLNQNQFDALVSFVYNVGPGGIAASTTVGKRLRVGDMRGAADALLAWDKAGGHRLPGLTRRRRAERALFLDEPVAQGPASWLTATELHWVRELDRSPTPARRHVLQAAIARRRKSIWRAAQPVNRGGDGRGWQHNQRHRRYRSLLAHSR